MTQFYKLMSSKLTLAEYWRLSNSLSEFLLYLKMKYVLPPMALGTGMARPDKLEFLQADQLPLRARRALDAQAIQISRLGFLTGFYYMIPSVGPQENYAVALLGRDAKMAASVVYCRERTGATELEQTVSGYGTELVNGPILTTANSKHTLNAPPGVESVRYPGLPVDELLDRHRRRLENLAPSEVQHWKSLNDLAEFVLKMNLNEFDEYFRRGLYQPMTADEVAAGQVARTEFLRYS